MGGKCSNLSQYTDNPCKISDCISKIKGLPARTNSPTDLWIVTFNEGVNYENEPVTNGFMKLFLSPKSFEGPLPIDVDWGDSYNQDTERKMFYTGLNYEIKVYRDIIRPLLDYKICPTFLKYISSAKNCDYKNLLDIVDKAGISKANLDRNLYILLALEDERAAIDDDDEDEEYEDTQLENPEKYKYSWLLTKYIPKGTKDIGDFTVEYMKKPDTPENIDKFLVIYFQILVGCYALSLTHTTHNDLHAGNIFLEKYSDPTDDPENPNKITYVINDVIYILETEYLPLIYDFDRTFNERLGMNFLLNTTESRDTSQLNKFIPNKDMLKTSIYIYNKVKYMKNIIVEIFTENNKEKIDSLLKWRPFFSDSEGIFPESWFATFGTPENILNNLINIMKKRNIFKTHLGANKKNLYVMDKEMFSAKGQILVDKVKEIQSSLSTELGI